MQLSEALEEALETARSSTLANVLALDALEKMFRSESAKIAAAQESLKKERNDVMEALVKEKIKLNVETERRREELEQDRRNLLAEMQGVSARPSEVIKLNVGGVRYETSRATLTKIPDSMLGRMFGRCDQMMHRAEDGSVFIDRNGARFDLILDYLRNNDDPMEMAKTVLSMPQRERQAMLRDLDFFGLNVGGGEEDYRYTVDAEEDSLTGTRLGHLLGMVAERPPPVILQRRRWAAAAFCAHQIGSGGGRLVLLAGGEIAALTTTTTTTHAETRRTECLDIAFFGERVGDVRPSRRHFPPHPLPASVEVKDAAVFLARQYAPQFVSGPELLEARCGCACVALPSPGKFLVVGGKQRSSTEVVDLATTMQSTPGPTMSTQRAYCCALTLTLARSVLVVGGEDADGSAQATTEFLDFDAMTSTPGPSMSMARTGHAIVKIDSGLLVIGGYDSSYCDSTEILDLETMTFRGGPRLLKQRHGCCAVLVGDGLRVLIAGGDTTPAEDDDEYLANVSPGLQTEILDLATMTFELGPRLKVPRFAPTAVPIGKNNVLIIGGDDSGTCQTEVVDLGGGGVLSDDDDDDDDDDDTPEQVKVEASAPSQQQKQQTPTAKNKKKAAAAAS